VDHYSLKGKHALVCGSSRGIGRAIGIEFAKLGASVTLLARNGEALKEVCNNLPSEGDQQHGYLTADFSEPEQLKQLIDAFLKDHPPFSILVNNTGGPPAGGVAEARPQEFKAAFSQHLISSHILLQALLPGMKASGYGRIINIISTSVKQPIAGLGVSNSIRGAMANWSKTLAGELGPLGITVNNVLPGPTETERLEKIFQVKASKTGKQYEEIKESCIQSIPLRRFAAPNEVAYGVAFLASPAAAFITGINLPVDGGRTSSL